MAFGGGAFGVLLDPRLEPSQVGLVPFEERRKRKDQSLSTTRGHSEKTTICRPGTGLSKCAGVLILGFPDSRTERKTFLLFLVHPVYGMLLSESELRQSCFKFFFLIKNVFSPFQVK